MCRTSVEALEADPKWQTCSQQCVAFEVYVCFNARLVQSGCLALPIVTQRVFALRNNTRPNLHFHTLQGAISFLAYLHLYSKKNYTAVRAKEKGLTGPTQAPETKRSI